MPIVNIFGFINKSRYFPDGRDLNRQFPGNSKGSLASRFVFNFSKEILPLADFCMDFHTGGPDRYNAAQIRIEDDNEVVSKLAFVFNAPFTLFGNQIEGSYRESCNKMDIPILLNESGKSLSLDKMICKEALFVVKRVLAHLEMLNPKIKVPAIVKKSTLRKEIHWIREDCSGFLHIKRTYKIL